MLIDRWMRRTLGSGHILCLHSLSLKTTAKGFSVGQDPRLPWHDVAHLQGCVEDTSTQSVVSAPSRPRVYPVGGKSPDLTRFWILPIANHNFLHDHFFHVGSSQKKLKTFPFTAIPSLLPCSQYKGPLLLSFWRYSSSSHPHSSPIPQHQEPWDFSPCDKSLFSFT